MPTTFYAVPNSDVSVQMTRSSGSHNYALVDDYPSTVDTTYCYASWPGYASTYIDLFTYPAFNTIPALQSILNVQIWLRGKAAKSTDYLNPYFYFGGNGYVGNIPGSGSQQSVSGWTTSFAWRGYEFSYNRQSGLAWTIGDLIGTSSYPLTNIAAAGTPETSGGEVWYSEIYMVVNTGDQIYTYAPSGGSIGGGSAPQIKSSGFQSTLGAIFGGVSGQLAGKVSVGGGVSQGRPYATGEYASFAYGGGAGIKPIVLQQMVYLPTDGALLGGQASENNLVNYAPIGGKINGGYADELRLVNFSPSDGMLEGGSAVRNVGYQVLPSGGAVNGGMAGELRKLVYIASSGAVYGGVTAAERLVNFVMSGGAVYAGIAARGFPVKMSGGVIFGGQLAQNRIVVFLPTQGMVSDGSVLISSNIPGRVYFTMEGGLIAGGSLAEKRLVTLIMNGGVILGGDAFLKLLIDFIASGGQVSDGTTLSLNVPLLLSYRHIKQQEILMSEGSFEYTHTKQESPSLVEGDFEYQHIKKVN